MTAGAVLEARGTCDGLAGPERRIAVHELVGDRLGLVIAPLLVDAAAVAAHAGLREGGDLERELLGHDQRLAPRCETVRQPHAVRLAGIDRAAGEHHVERTRHADQPRQAHRAAVDQRNAEAAAEHAEDRGLVRHAQIAPGGQLDTAGHAIARYGRDHGFRPLQPRRAHRTVAVRFQSQRAPRLAAGDRFQIGAGAEMAVGPSEDRDPQFRIGVEGAERGRECVGGGPVDAVADLGTIDADHQQRRAAFDDDGGSGGVGHVGFLGKVANRYYTC